MSLPQPSIPEIAVLDGGTGTYLTENGHPEISKDPLWGSGLLYRDIDAIRKVHLSFLSAGSDIIETVTYQASVDGFMTHLNLTEKEALALIGKGVQVALDVRAEFWQDHPEDHNGRLFPLVAGSVGPYGACRADGSEYTGDYVINMSKEELITWHRPRIKVLLEAGVDLLALDTIPAQKEALALVQLLEDEFPQAKAWLSFSCKDAQHTSHGEDIVDVIESMSGCKQLVGIGFNCTAPEHITELLQKTKPHAKDKKLIVYPNSGEKWTEEKTWHGGEDLRPLHDYAETWYQLGATWIGGCCRVSPDDISKLRQVMVRLKKDT